MTGLLVYVVCYDIRDPKRLRLVYKTMRGYGEHLQYSVFLCKLEPANKVRMVMDLTRIIHEGEDRIVILHLGPAHGRYASRIETLGSQTLSGESGPHVF